MGFDSEGGSSCSTTTYSVLGSLVWQAHVDLLLVYRYLLHYPFQSLYTGRPPSFSLAYIDCGFPQYDASSNGKGGSIGSSCELFNKISWGHILSPFLFFLQSRFGRVVSLQNASRKLLLAFLQQKYHLTRLSWSLIVKFASFHCHKEWFLHQLTSLDRFKNVYWTI
jgi:hypothetical protein